MEFLRERIVAFPDLGAARLTREVRELGYAGVYTAVKRFLDAIRPENGPKPYEMRFETPPGVQAQVDSAPFVVDFTDDPGSSRVFWLFSLVLGHSRFLFACYVLHQELQTMLRCHIQAFEAIGGVPIEILYDRMKTAVTGEDDQGHIAYNPSLLALARHYRFRGRVSHLLGGAPALRRAMFQISAAALVSPLMALATCSLITARCLVILTAASLHCYPDPLAEFFGQIGFDVARTLRTAVRIARLTIAESGVLRWAFVPDLVIGWHDRPPTCCRRCPWGARR
jgi:hypothetical protein